jgi:polyisoprenoid-binding protein YceI
MNSRRFLNIFSTVLVFGLVAVFSASAYAAESYKVDPEHTSLVFRVKHFGVADVYGRFNGPTGSFVFDESSPSNSSIQVQVNAKDVDTAVEQRDNDLRGPDFFNAAEHPLVSFKSTSVKKLTDGTYEVAGNLTLLSNSRPLTVKVHHTGTGKDPWGNFRRGFETSFTIKRSEFGMDFMLSGYGDEVAITVIVEGIRQ